MRAPMQKLIYVGASEKTPEEQIATVNRIQEATEQQFDEAMAEEERLENERRTNGFDFEMDAAGVFHMFTLQGLLSFVMMFGIFGLAVSQSGDNTNAVLAVLAGTAAGTASMYVVAKVFQAMQSLESDGTVVHNKALGARGTVYRRIDPNKPGQVQVEFQGALRTMSARSDDEAATLETGSLIEVVDTIGEILIVAPLDRKAPTRKEEE